MADVNSQTDSDNMHNEQIMGKYAFETMQIYSQIAILIMN